MMADLTIFLPKIILRLLDEKRNFTVEEGTILFCDVAGFTPLTETLSKMGKEGVEELTTILNNYFTEMIEISDDYGGDVIRFGGDAMTIFFAEGLQINALLASQRMMKKMEKFKEIRIGNNQFSLEMKIGISCGATTFGVLREESGQMDYYAAGAALDESSEAEHRAEKGKIVLHPAFIKKVKMDFIPMKDGYAEFSGEENPLKKTLPAKSEGAIPQNIETFLPRHLIDRAGEGALGEHRGAAVIFIGFEGISPGGSAEDAEKFHSDLNVFFRHLVASCQNYGGIVNKVDMGDKGMKAILLFGSPYALENKEEMAVRCALEIRDKNPIREKISVKMGMTTSQLFTGPVGSPRRREFTVMGDGINTAARFMQKAGRNQIFCDEATKCDTDKSIEYIAIEPLTLKGKEKAVPAFMPIGFSKRNEKTELPEIIERDEILKKIKSLLLSGGKPILISGEAGLGKTVLIERARRESLALGYPTTRVFLAPYHRTRPYSLWKGALRNLIGAQKGDSPEKTRELLTAMIDENSRIYAPLLNPILGIEEEEAGNVSSLSPKERKELTFAIAEKIFLNGGERVILADNVEMADPLSLELLNFVFQGSAELPLKIVVSCRSLTSDLERIAGHFEKIELRPLSEIGVQNHLTLNFKLKAVGKTLLDWFYLKTQGNPKIVSAIFQILTDKQIISREGGSFVADEDLLFKTPFPEKLEEIYLKKIDELPGEEREIVQIASVLGYSVSLFLLSFMAQKEVEYVRAILKSLTEKVIFRSDSWGERPYLKFTDSLLRDAVYNSLPFALKREIHFKCASFLERESGEKNEPLSYNRGSF